MGCKAYGFKDLAGQGTTQTVRVMLGSRISALAFGGQMLGFRCPHAHAKGVSMSVIHMPGVQDLVRAGHNPREEQNVRCPVRGLTLKALRSFGLKVHVRSEAWDSGFESGYLKGKLYVICI